MSNQIDNQNRQNWQDREKVIEQAALYALGMLSQGEAQAFERVAGQSPSVGSAELESFNRVVETLGLSAPESAPAASVRERLIRQIADESESRAPGAQGKKALSALAQRSLSVRANQGKWRETSKGAFVKILFVDRVKRTITTLVRLMPGARLPRHRHHGTEESFVVEGDCLINGERFGPGDYRCALEGTIDSELTTVGGTLVLMISPQKIEVLEPN